MSIKKEIIESDLVKRTSESLTDDESEKLNEYIDHISDICDRFMNLVRQHANTIDGRDLLCEDIADMMRAKTDTTPEEEGE